MCFFMIKIKISSPEFWKLNFDPLYFSYTYKIVRKCNFSWKLFKLKISLLFQFAPFSTFKSKTLDTCWVFSDPIKTFKILSFIPRVPSVIQFVENFFEANLGLLSFKFIKWNVGKTNQDTIWTKRNSRKYFEMLLEKKRKINANRVIFMLEHQKFFNHDGICIPVRSLLQGSQTSNWS